MVESTSVETVYRSCPICEASCGLKLEVDRSDKKVLSIRGDEADPRSHGYVCPKSQAMKAVYEDPDRIRHPLRRTENGFEEISWEEALDEVGKRLKDIREAHGPNAIGSYIGNPTGHNFGAMLYTAFFMQALDSYRAFNGGSVDQFPKNVSCSLLYGDPWLFPIPDIDHTDFLIVLGANPLISQGSLLSAPNAKARLRAHRDKGGKLVTIDPRRTETAAVADEHLFIKPGSDAFLLFAFVHVLFEEELVAPGRLAEFVDGIEQVRELAQPFSPEHVAEATGISAEAIRDLVRAFAAAERAVLYGRFGTCTQEFGTLTSWLVDVVNILTGNFDRPGGLMFPRAATGQTEPVPVPNPAMVYGENRSAVRGVPVIDGQMPVAVMAEEIDSAGEDRVRGFITVAGNPILSTPNGERLGKAFEQLEFMVSIDIYLNETTRYANIILPTTTHLEHSNYDFLFSTTSVRNMARFSPRVFEPDPEARHHWLLLLEVAARMNGIPWETLDDMMLAGMLATFLGKPDTAGEKVSPEQARKELSDERGPERLLDLMLRAGPHGDGFDDSAEGLSLEKLSAIPHALDLGPLQPRLPNLLRTPGRRINLVSPLLVKDIDRLQAARDGYAGRSGLVLVGRRQLQNMNSWLHNLEPLAKGKPRCTLLIHPDDAERAGLPEAGGLARIRSRTGELEVQAEVSDEMMPGVVSLPHGYGHGAKGTKLSVASSLQPGVNTNQLADELLIDEVSGTSVLCGIPVEVSVA
jgi:anaerobic selenocysteine-containing dehydrogenase